MTSLRTMPPYEPGEKKPRQTIQSVERAARILRSVAKAPDGLTATQVADRIGLTLSTTYHLLATLEAETLLSKEHGKRYVLGAGAADIANAPALYPRVPKEYRNALNQLAKTTRETAYLTAWFRGEVRILATVEGSQAVRVAGLEVGLTGDVHARASAKILLAFTDEAHRNRILDGHAYTQFTPHTVKTRPELEAQLTEIRRTGIWFDRGEYQEDSRSLSMPIRRDGEVVGAFAVLAPADRFQRTRANLLEALQSAVRTAES